MGSPKTKHKRSSDAKDRRIENRKLRRKLKRHTFKLGKEQRALARPLPPYHTAQETPISQQHTTQANNIPRIKDAIGKDTGAGISKFLWKEEIIEIQKTRTWETG